MRPEDVVIAVAAGAPLTSVGLAWLVGLLSHHLRVTKLSTGLVVGQVVLLLLEGSLIGAAGIAVYRGYVSYNLFHPYGWIWAFSIVWLILLALFYVAGSDRRSVVGFVLND